jgi:DNA-binding response OmpR family regulator
MSAAPLKILVVDDEPPIRKLLRVGLSTQGYQILEAPNGKTSLDLLEQKPDLVILDLGLPDMQGLDLLRTMRARNERIVKVGDREVKLSPKEYDLLRVLVQHAGKVLTHRFLLGELWDDLTDAQYLRVYVRQLRQKIEEDPERPHYVLTETGIGYRLRAPD